MENSIFSYVKLIIAALLPVIAAGLFYLLDRKTAFRNIPGKIRNVIYGLVFGLIAVFGTECGIPMNGAQVNCRDAAVLIAGLLFSGPAGIIAGIIGGVERWIAVAWGIGSFTRVACSVSTILAGFYAAALRKYLFEDKKPGWLLSLAIGVVMEVFHLTMVFITNMSSPETAMAVVKACTIPLVAANGVSVMLGSLLLAVLSHEKISLKADQVRISQTIQRWLMVTVMLAFVVTSYFVFQLQDTLASKQTDDQLEQAMQEIADDLRDAVDNDMYKIADNVRIDLLKYYSINDLLEKYDLAEIDVVNKEAIITESSEPGFVGFDMSSGEQSDEFNCLLGLTNRFAQSYGPISFDDSIMRKYAGIKTNSGYLQIGYNEKQYYEAVERLVDTLAVNRHIGQTGFSFILDEKETIISTPKDILAHTLERNLVKVVLPGDGITFRAEFCGKESFCRTMTTEGCTIISVLPVDEAVEMRNIALYVNAFMEILVFAVLFALIYTLIKRVVVIRIKSINNSLGKITGGDLNEVVNVRTSEEFASLSDDINSTVDTLKRYIAEASARIDAELEFAKNIQASALPNKFPAFPKRKDFDIFASMNPAKEVGGDFYDFYMTGSDTLNFLIADVSGKGIPAAMFMMQAKTELKTLTEADVPLNDVFTRGNAALCEGNDAGMFVTAWQGSLDLTNGKVLFANAGHNPPLVRRDGKFEYLRSRAGFVLAGMDGVKYKTQELQLAAGDEIYLYTDGVTEATNASNELYGEERLLAAVNSREFESVEALCRFVKNDVDAFVGEAPQFDDITMVGLKYVGKPPMPEIRFEEAKIADITELTAFIEEELEKLDCPMKTTIQFNIAVDEIYSNIVKYGYPKKPGPVMVRVVYKEDPRRVYIRFEDHGIPYNPLNVADPDITLSAEERQIGGLGIYMVKKSMDSMKYKYENDCNILTIMKTLPD